MNSENSSSNSQPKSPSLSRRKFLASTAALTAFSVVPARVLGRAAETSPNNKLNIAGIGIGGQGNWDLDQCKSENIVALCDVDWGYAGPVFDKYPTAKRYRDYREMLDKEKGIDAVVIATPDHNHAIASITAMK